MRSFLVGALMAALTACGSQEVKQRPQPPPPPRPEIKGAVKSVSSADIREIIAFMRKHIIKEHGSFVPIYSISIVDRNSASVVWWDNGVETITPLDRIHGRWQLSKDMIERIITTGVNFPTS